MKNKSVIIFIILIMSMAVTHAAIQAGSGILVPDKVTINVSRTGNDHMVTASGTINADIDSVWLALIDYDNHEDYMPNVVESKIISRNGTSMMVFKQIKVSFKKTDMVLKVTVNKGTRICTWAQHSGNFRKNQGKWVLKDNGNNMTRITYSAMVEPDFYMPEWLKTHLQEKSVPGIIRAVGKRAVELRNR